MAFTRKAFGIGFLSVAVIVTGTAFWFATANSRAHARLEARLQKLRDAGEPTTLADLKPERIPPEDNAATFLDQARDDLNEISEIVWKSLDDVSDSDAEAFWHDRPDAKMLATVASVLKTFPQAVPLVEKAANSSGYAPKMDFAVTPTPFVQALLDHISLARDAERALHYQVLLLLSQNRVQEALDTCLAMLKLSRHLDQNPTTVCGLVAVAVRGCAINLAALVLQSGAIPNELHDELESELAGHDLRALYRHMLRSERCFGLDCFRFPDDSELDWKPGRNDEDNYLDYLEFALRTADRPYWDNTVRDENARLLARSSESAQRHFPDIGMYAEVFARAESELRCLRLLNSLTRDKWKDVSQAPSIADLQVPAEVGVDPFNGEPLHIKKLPEGWLVYSVGPNLQDDGGNLSDEGAFDRGLGPPPPKAVQSAVDDDKSSAGTGNSSSR